MTDDPESKIKFRLFSRKRRKLFISRRLYYFHLVGRNGEIIASSEGYYNRADRLATIQLIQRGALLADIEDMDK